MPYSEVKVEPSVVLLHCKRKDQYQGYDLECDIHAVTIRKPNQYEFKVACPYQHTYERVRTLVFEKSRVEFLPKSLFNTLRYVQKATIHDSDLKVLHPEAFLYAKELKSLDLSQNLLELLGPMEFVGAKNLEILDVSNNQIHFIDADAFEGLMKLQVLRLGHNLLKNMNSDALVPLIRLKILDLSENFLDDPQPRFCQNRTFYSLNLSQNSHKDLNCVNALIENLHLSGNPIKNIQRKTFISTKGLIFLDLSKTHIHGTNFGSLDKGINLYHLNLSGCRLEDLNIRSFINAPNIQILDVSYNKLGSLDVNIFKPLEHLEHLYLSGNDLIQFDFETLKQNHPNLTIISIADNDWSCSYLDKILQTFCRTNITISYQKGVACRDAKGDIIIPIDRVRPDLGQRQQATFSEQLWFYFLLASGTIISLYLAYFILKNTCLPRMQQF